MRAGILILKLPEVNQFFYGPKMIPSMKKDGGINSVGCEAHIA
jgi:hypothetical protein